MRSSAVKYIAPFNNVNNSSILGRDISAKAAFMVPIAGVTAGNKEFNFLYSIHKQNCCGKPSGVWLWMFLILFDIMY